MATWIGKICSLVGESRKAGYLTLLFVLSFLALLGLLLFQVRAIYNISLPLGTEAAKIPGLGSVPSRDAREVLILNSYHIGYSWSDNEMAGMVEKLREADPKIQPLIEYLDCKHYPEMDHFDRLRDLFRQKYRSKDLPLVLVADNPALEFALKYRPELFPRAAIVFCGINGYDPRRMAGRKNVTGIAELLDAYGTVSLALKLHPATREIVIVHDYTITGLATRKETEQQLAPFAGRVGIRYLPNLDMAGLLDELHALPPDRLVLALSYSLDKHGQVVNHEKISRLLSENSPVPVYGLHEERLGYGIVGGSLLGGKVQGEHAAEVACRILSGAPAESVPVDIKSPTRLMLDYNQLKRFRIPLSALPKEAVVVNRPVSFVAEHPDLALTTLGIIALLGTGIIVLLFNILQRKLAEEQQRRIGAQLIQAQKMEAVGQLAGGIAHDFNNILTAIIGYATLLRKRVPDDDTMRSYVDQVLSAASRAARLTRGLLAFSRKQVIEPSVVDINEIVSGIERITRRVIGEDIEFSTILCPSQLHVLADAGQIDQVLMNLCANARDAMPDGGRLTIETSRVVIGEGSTGPHALPRGSYTVVSVSDTGMGMDERTRRQIFEPFFTTKEVGKGTGLGLSIVYGIVQQHNGTVMVSSEPGKGTTFEIFLPLTAGMERPREQAVAARPAGGTETILLAEDEAEVRTMIRIVLSDAGYRVIEATDGEDGLQKFSQDPDAVRLLLSDVIMPKRNGKELAEAVHAQRPGVKLLFMSGYTADIVQKKGILDHEVRFLSKPVLPDQLLKAVREVLDA